MTTDNDKILDLEGMVGEAKLSRVLITRALRSGGLKGKKVPGGGGWRTTRSQMLEWANAGFPGIEVIEGDDDSKDEVPG